MSVRQTRLEEAIFEGALYANPAAAIGASVGLLDQIQQDARVDLVTEYRGSEPAYLSHPTPQYERFTTRGDAEAAAAVMPLHGPIFFTLNYSMMALNGGVVDTSLVNAQRCSFLTVGTSATGQSITAAIPTFGVGKLVFPTLSNGTLSVVCNEQSLVVVDDATTSPRTLAPVLSKYLWLLAARSAVLSETQFSSLVRQLRALLSDVEEPSTLESAKSVASFRGLIKFLADKRPSHPNLSISRTGLFVASWSPKKRAELSLTFSDADGGDWYALSLDEFLNDEGKFLTSTFNLPPPFGSWMTQ